MKYYFDQNTNQIHLTTDYSLVPPVTWSCAIISGNFTLSQYYGTLPTDSSQEVIIQVKTYNTIETVGKVMFLFKNETATLKRTLGIICKPEFFYVEKDFVEVYGNETNSFLSIRYANSENFNLFFTLGEKNGETYTYDGNYMTHDRIENGVKLYTITVYSYNLLNETVQVKITSKCSYEFNDKLIISTIDDNKENKSIITINQGSYKILPSVLEISPSFIYLNSDNPIQKINVTSTFKGESCEYKIFGYLPNSGFTNDDYLEYLSDDTYEWVDSKNKKQTYFFIDMSDCEPEDDNVNGVNTTPYQLYVVNSKDTSLYKKLEFFYDWTLNESNHIYIESVEGVYAYVNKNIKYSENNVIEFDMNSYQTNITLVFVKNRTVISEEIMNEYQDSLFAVYDENNGVNFTIKSEPNKWTITTLSDNVNEVKLGDKLLVSLLNNINTNDDFIVLTNDLGSKCTIRIKTYDKIFSEEQLYFGLSKNNDTKYPVSNLITELKEENSFTQTLYLISESENEIIYTFNKTLDFEIDNSKNNQITLNTVYYINDGKQITTKIDKFNFNILFNQDNKEYYINYGPVTKKEINGTVTNDIYDFTEIYFTKKPLENTKYEITIPEPYKSKYIPWSITNNGTGIKYKIFVDNVEQNQQTFIHCPNKRSTKIIITDILPQKQYVDKNDIYLIPSITLENNFDVSTLFFKEIYKFNECCLFIDRKPLIIYYNFTNKYGLVENLNSMKTMTSNSFKELFENNDSLQKINVKQQESGKGYYSSFEKINNLKYLDNGANVSLYISKPCEIIYESPDIFHTSINQENSKLYKYEVVDKEIFNKTNDEQFEEIIKSDAVIKDNWEINDGLLVINGELFFPQVGVVTVNSDYSNVTGIMFKDNKNDSIIYAIATQQKKYVSLNENYEVCKENEDEYIIYPCIYQTMEKSISINNMIYEFDDVNKHFLIDDNYVYPFKENEQWYAEIQNQTFNIKTKINNNEKICYIDYLDEEIELNEDLMLPLNGNLYEPSFSINLKGVKLNVLENNFGFNQNNKEQFIILNDKKFVATTNLGQTIYKDFVDLNLPSGNKWSKYNVGAESENDYGLLFQWGETNGYVKESIIFNGTNYKFNIDENEANPTLSAMTKYNTYDNLLTLEKIDDACVTIMGGDWKIPSVKDCQELIDNTTIEKTTINDVEGVKYTGKNGQYIFIPNGSQQGDTFNSNNAYIWTNEVFEFDAAYAKSLNGEEINVIKRFSGLPIRSVAKTTKIDLNLDTNLSVENNLIDLNTDFNLNVITKPQRKYVIIDGNKYILINNVLEYNGFKYNVIVFGEDEIIVISKKGYNVYKENAEFYYIINNKRYDLNNKLLTENNITFNDSISEVSETQYYTVSEIENENFVYEIDWNKILTYSYVDAFYNTHKLTNGYVEDIDGNKYIVEKLFYLKEINGDYFVFSDECVKMKIGTGTGLIMYYVFEILDDTELTLHGDNGDERRFITGGTEVKYPPLIYQHITFNDYTTLKFKMETIIKFKNDCTILCHEKTIKVKENECFVFPQNCVVTFTDITKIELFKTHNIPLTVFKNASIINGEVYQAIENNGQKVISYNNQIYYINNNKITVNLDDKNEIYDVYEKMVFYKKISIIGNDEINVSTKWNEVKPIRSKTPTEDTSTNIASNKDYGYLDGNQIKFLSETDYSDLKYNLYLPKYDNEYNKWCESKFYVSGLTIYNTNDFTSSKAYFEYLGEKIIIENGKFNFKTNVYEIYENDEIVEVITTVNDKQKTFSGTTINGNDYEYSFWDYYANTYVKKVNKINLNNPLNLSISKQISLNNVLCKVDENKYVKIDNNFYPIFETYILDLTKLNYFQNTVTLYLNTYVNDENKIVRKKYIITRQKNPLNENDFSYSLSDTYTPFDFGDSIDNIINFARELEVLNGFSTYKMNSDNYYYIIYDDKLQPIINKMIYIDKKINLININSNLSYALFDADSCLTHNVDVFIPQTTNKIKQFVINNKIEIPTNIIIAVEAKINSENKTYKKYGGFYINLE